VHIIRIREPARHGLAAAKGFWVLALAQTWPWGADAKLSYAN